MSTVIRIKALKDYGIFREFIWPAELIQFGKQNLIYGTNGTGKTTLSNLMRALELRRPIQVGSAVLELDDGDVTGASFGKATASIRVFNQEFVRENVFPVGDMDVAPIFVLGAENVSQQRHLDELRRKHDTTTKRLSKVNTDLAEAIREIDDLHVSGARSIREALRSTEISRYNNYDKANYRARAEQMVRAGDRSKHKASEDLRAQLVRQFHSASKPTLETVPDQFATELEQARDSTSRLLQRSVVARVVTSLSDDADVSSWARAGLHLHHQRDTPRCLYCDQIIPADRVSALEGHFNSEYDRLLAELDAAADRLERSIRSLIGLRLPRRAELLDDLASQYEMAEPLARTAIDSLHACFTALLSAVENKKRSPLKLDLRVELPAVDTTGIDELNKIIGAHNEASNDLAARRALSGERFEAAVVEASVDDLTQRNVNRELFSKESEEGKRELSSVGLEISLAEQRLIEHHRPAEELNENLRRYLGHDELSLAVKDTGYTITRRDSPAVALSEGEATAIALLYFLKSLDDRRFDRKNGIVVLDDPVSSLDSNALYLAFGFIRQHTEDVGQLFVLTHNFTFFRQIRNWFKQAKGQRSPVPERRPARFYMLSCVLRADRRESEVTALDPLLEKYESEYHYLFNRVYQAAAQSSPAEFAEHYVLPNMARRLLEAFLAFRYPQMSGELYQKLERVNFDQAKKIRILRFMHTYSHADTIGEPDHDISHLSESAPVLTDLIELMRSEDPGHVAAMTELSTANDETTDDQ